MVIFHCCVSSPEGNEMINDRRNGEPQGSLRVFHEQGSGWSGNWWRYGEIVRRQWLLGSKLFQNLYLVSWPMDAPSKQRNKDQSRSPSMQESRLPAETWSLPITCRSTAAKSSCSAQSLQVLKCQERYGRKHLQDLKPCVIMSTPD